MYSREVKSQLLEAAVQRQEDPDLPVNMAMLINDIDETNN